MGAVRPLTEILLVSGCIRHILFILCSQNVHIRLPNCEQTVNGRRSVDASVDGSNHWYYYISLLLSTVATVIL